MKKSFHFLWASQLFANLGDVFYIVGLISILYQSSASPFYLALLPFLNMAGRMISSSFAPLLFHNYRLKPLLVLSQSLKTVLLLLLSIGATHAFPLFGILMCIFVVAFLDGIAQPASTALIPRIVPKDKLLRANSILSIVNESTNLGAWALGGILVAFTSGVIVIWLTFLLFILSTICLGCIIDNTPFEKKQQTSKSAQLTEGFRLIWHERAFRTIHVMIMFESIAGVVWVAAIMYIFVADVLHVSESWWGYINTAFFIGLLLGGVICTRYERLFNKHFKRVLLSSSFGIAIVMLAFGLNRIALLALVFSGLFGLFEQCKGIVMNTWLQQTATDDQLIHIYSAQGVLTALLFGVSTLVAGAMATVLPIQWLFVVAGCLLLICAIYVTIVRKRFSASSC